MFILFLVVLSSSHNNRYNHRRNHIRKHRGGRNSDSSLEVICSDSGDLEGIRLGPPPRFRRYRTTRLLTKLLRRVQEDKKLTEEIEEKGRSGIENLLKQQLGAINPYLKTAKTDYTTNKKQSQLADKILDQIFDNLTKTLVERVGSLF